MSHPIYVLGESAIARLTAELERTLRLQSVRPIIVKTPRYMDLWNELISFLPTSLTGSLAEFFPRITGVAEAALAYPKIIPSFNMLSLPATPLIIEQLAQDNRVEKIYPDRLMYAFQTVPDEGIYYDPLNKLNFTTTYWTRKLLGLEEANAEGWTGKGVKVAIVDTGAGVHQQIPIVERRTVMTGQYSDGSGHGTYCATTIAGRETMDTAFRVPVAGMAPDVNLVSIKSLGYVIGVGKESDVLKGMELAASCGANIINFSLGSDNVPANPEDDPQTEVIKKLTQENIICVVAAGNTGKTRGSICSPGVAPDALTVGGFDELTGQIPDFSSRGPTPWGDVKPDVVGPAVRVDSGTVNLLDLQGDKRPQRFSYLCGTSISAPHIAGVIACAKQMFNASGLLLDASLIKEICSTYSGREKTNDDGWGLLKFSYFKKYLQEH